MGQGSDSPPVQQGQRPSQEAQPGSGGPSQMEPEGRTGHGNRGEVTSEGKWGGRKLLDGAPGVSDAPDLRSWCSGCPSSSQVLQGRRLCVLDLGKAL